MVLRPRHGLSLCAGGGGLDMGLMLAEPGFHTRCFVEWEEYPRQCLIAAQRAGYFAPAPIWDDLTTFDGRPFRGAFDTVLAGYPCQPFSHAGQRRGHDDERHLWPDVARIVREVEPEWVFLENVAGHVSLGAETVLRDLWDMGYTPAAGLFSASETGAPHERLRWFCVAYRDSGNGRANSGAANAGTDWRDEFSRGCGDAVAHADGRNASTERQQRGGQQRLQPECGAVGAGDVVHPGRSERRAGAGGGCIPDRHDAGRPQKAGGASEPGDIVDNAASPRREPEGIGPGSDIEGGECLSRAGRDELADAERDAGHEGRRGHRVDPEAGGIGQANRAGPSRPYLFPPGPGDAAAWAAVLRSSPDMAPAASARDLHAWARRMEADGREWWQAEAEPAFCRMVDGLSHRSQPLRLLGNAVHPLTAGLAWRSLAAAHGLQPIDLGGTER